MLTGIAQSGDLDTNEAHGPRIVATVLVAVGGSLSLIAFFGWMAGSPGMANLGLPGYPAWPLTALGYTGVALGLLAALHGRSAAARWLWVIPAGIAVTTLFERALGIDLGIDQLLFTQQLEQLQVRNAGRPGWISIAVLCVTLLTCFSVVGPKRRRSKLFAIAALCVAATGMMAALLPGGEDPVLQLLRSPILACLSALCIAGAVVAHATDFSWLKPLAEKAHLRVAWLVPAMLALPILQSAVAIWILKGVMVSPFSGMLLILASNVAVALLLTYWAAKAVAHDQGALRAREAQLRSILETVPDAIIVMDQRGTIRQFSAAAEQLFGYPASEVIGEYFTMLAPPEDRERYSEALQAYRLGNTDQQQFAGRVVPGVGQAADGRHFPMELRTGVAHADGQALFTIFVRDLSGRIADEMRMGDLHAELAHVARQNAMSDLAADLAHELNQPLTAASNFLSAARMLVTRGKDIDRAAELMRMAGEQTLRSGEIVRRIRDFVARRDNEVHAEPIERAVHDAVELVLVGTGRFDVSVAYDLDPTVPSMCADRVQVQQVLVNLLRNAIEAQRKTPRSRRRIAISTRAAPDHMVEFRVDDNGPGIPPEMIERLCTRFVSTKQHEGLGIGLSISRRIVEAHGGALSAENREGGGCRFRFTVPAAQPGEMEMERQQPRRMGTRA